MLLDPLNRDEQRLGHLHTQERNHEPILEDVMHELVVLGECGGVDHGVDDEIFELVSDLLHDEQLHEGDISIFGHAEQRTRDHAAADVQLRTVQQQLDGHQASHAVCVEIQRQLRPGLGKQCDDVILQDFHGGTPSRPSGVPESSQIYQQHLEIMNGIVVGNLAEAPRVFPKPMNNGNTIPRAGRGELSMIQPDIGQLRGQVLFFDDVAILLELAEEVISLHFW